MKRLRWGEDIEGEGRQRPTERTLLLLERRLAPQDFRRPTRGVRTCVGRSLLHSAAVTWRAVSW